MATPVLDAIQKRRPILGALARAADALFAKGGDFTLPTTPAMENPETGETIPPQLPITIRVPVGITRDPANRSAFVTALFIIANIFGWDVFGLTPEAANDVYNAGALIFATLTGILRTKSKNLTRG